MFGYTYKLAVPNAKKPNVVKLTPTISTWIKAFAPLLVIMGVLTAVSFAAEAREKREIADLDD
jgi:hypothetical protein